MTVNYTAKADSGIRILASTEPQAWEVGDLPVTVQGFRRDGTLVIEGVITIYISGKPPRKAA